MKLLFTWTGLALLFSFLAQSRAQSLVLVAGGGTNKFGPATQCQLIAPFGVDFDRSGNMYIVEMAGGERVLKVSPQGMLSVFAGLGEKGDTGDGGPATEARFNGIHSLALGPGDDLFVADTWNNRVRKIDVRNGRIVPFAGTGKRGFSGDGGTAMKAEFGNVYCVAFDRQRENLYLADLDNRRIRVINLKSGDVSTVAGNGERGVPGDGSKATDAPLVDPRAVALDSNGNIYILERSGHALRLVHRNGVIRTVAGTGKKGSVDGPALSASFNGPKHLCVDAHDNVIIADTENHLIRQYLPKENKVVSLVRSQPKPALNQPHGVYITSAGMLYIADSSNNRVVRLEQ
jgi:DNA-binding beta-propeller fold protein YncE